MPRGISLERTPQLGGGTSATFQRPRRLSSRSRNKTSEATGNEGDFQTGIENSHRVNSRVESTLSAGAERNRVAPGKIGKNLFRDCDANDRGAKSAPASIRSVARSLTDRCELSRGNMHFKYRRFTSVPYIRSRAASPAIRLKERTLELHSLAGHYEELSSRSCPRSTTNVLETAVVRETRERKRT